MPTPAARRRRLIVQALLPLMVLGAWIAVLLWQVTQLVDTARWVDHTDQVLRELQQLDTIVSRQLAAARGYVIVRDAAMLDAYERSSDFTSRIAHAAALTADNPAQVARIRALAASMTTPTRATYSRRF